MNSMKPQMSDPAPPMADIAGEAMARLSEARAAWIAYITATTRDENFAAVARMHRALAVSDKDLPDEGC